MNDRFKFRAGVTIGFYDDDGGDKEISIIIEPNAVWRNGCISIYEEEISKVLARLNLSCIEIKTIWDYLETHTDDGELYTLCSDYIEQCVGIKDKNGKLIYDGDFVIDDWGVISKVEYDDECAQYCMVTENGGYSFFLSPTNEKLEIIGNIHENRELLNDR